MQTTFISPRCWHGTREKPLDIRLLIRANESAGVRVVFGKLKRRDVRCRLCGGVFTKPEEKQTDVNIAIELLRLAVADRYDKAILISGDTDLLPAVKAVQTTFPGKQIGVVLPIRPSV
ncbi:MAG: NYN domain-containing protein [Candidatus Acidiferrales bacterium]